MTRRWCLITGAANGMGRDLARGLLAEEWSIAALDSDGAGLGSLQEETGAGPDRLVLQHVDVRDRSGVAEAVGAIGERGELVALVNNAGIISVGDAIEMKQVDWDDVIDVNVTGAFYVAQAVAARMVEEGTAGRILNVGTISGKVPRWGRISYCVSKAAISHMTRCLALELAGHGITVNTVSAGSAAIGVVAQNIRDGHSTEESLLAGDLDRYRLGVPMGRLARSEDVLGLVRYLLSDDASHVTGQEMRIDGGQSMF